MSETTKSLNKAINALKDWMHVMPEDILFQCPHCASEYLIDTTDGTFEDYQESEKSDGELTTVNQMIEDDDEPSFKTDPEYSTNTTYDRSYANNTPMVPGRATENGSKIINKPVTSRGSGIRVATAMATTPPPGVRQQRRKLQLQPPGNMKGVFGPKKKKLEELTDADHSREGFEVTGSDASQDFVGMGGWEGHFDNLQQSQFESDPYGFQPDNR